MTDSRLIVLDAGPIIHLDELGCLDLLEDFASLKIPLLVWHEVQKHREQIQISKLKTCEIIPQHSKVSFKLATFAKSLSLDAGEIEALALMEESQGTLFLCDDAAARLAGESLGIEVRGTIGILVRAIRRGRRTQAEVKSLLEEIPNKSTLHINRRLLDKIIKDLE
jgi:predicted nucleic acid-binding protein